MSLSLELSQLATLVAFAEHPRLIDAARVLGVSQPTLSYQLKRIEAASDIPIFTFEGRRKVLTPYGEALASGARGELGRVARSLGDVRRRFGSPEALRIEVGCRRDRFARVRECIQFAGTMRFHNLSSVQALEQLQKREIDIAVLHERPDLPGVVARKLFSSSPRFLVHKRWLAQAKAKTAERAARSADFLRVTPALLYREGEPFLARWLSKLGISESEIQPRLICEDWATLVSWAAQGEGFALVPSDLELPQALIGDVSWVDLPERDLEGLTFFAVYSSAFKKIPAFERGLKILSLP